MEERIRCFVAIDFPDEVIKEAARVQEQLENWSFDGKMSELENLHVTLKFLGEIEKERVEEIRERLKKIEFKDMELRMERLGIFKIRGSPRVVWIKIAGKEIFELQKRVDECLKGLFEKEEGFESHLTIARVKYVEDKKGFLDYISKIGIKEIKFNVKSFKLMKSELRRNGPFYSTIEEYALRQDKI